MLKHFDRESMIWGADIPANEKLFLLALNSFVDANGECYPGLELLARMTGFTERTCRTIRDRLKDKGIITTGRRYNSQGFRSSDRYRINFDAIKSLPERISTGNLNLPENGASLPEIDDTPTGNSLQSLPERISRDLSSKNYPEEPTQIEQAQPSGKMGGSGFSSDIERFESQFRAQENPPWVIGRCGSVRQYDKGFKAYLVKYLAALSCYKGKTVQDVDAVKWLNAANYTNTPDGQRRLDDACAMWEDYQDRQRRKPTSHSSTQSAYDTDAVSRDVIAHSEWAKTATPEDKAKKRAEVRAAIAAAQAGGQRNVPA
jgi:hypothetical protein